MKENLQPTVKWKRLDPEVKIPEYKTKLAAGMDICSNENIIIQPWKKTVVNTGLAMGLPAGFECQVRSRSGLAANHSIIVANAPGTIDEDYTGEIKVILFNLSNKEFFIEKGDRIAQLVVTPYVQTTIKIVENLDTTERGEGGFGSTGIK